MHVLWAALMVWFLRKYWRTPDDLREARIYRDGKFWCAERSLYDWVDERALS
jgi:hypothetical protein